MRLALHMRITGLGPSSAPSSTTRPATAMPMPMLATDITAGREPVSRVVSPTPKG